MNCLLLLYILFCCNGNENCGGRNCNYTRCGQREEHMNHSHSNNNHGTECSRDNICQTAPPPMPRTQFPYLDMEPRTCGCEEKTNN